MTSVVVDTSFYIAFSNPRDRWHNAAKSVAQTYSRNLLTTEFILVEVGNYLCEVANRAPFLQLHNAIRSDETTRIVPVSSDLLEQGMRLFENRSDKAWSLTDCTSIAVMLEHGLQSVLTTDHHFEQAGFEILLRE